MEKSQKKNSARFIFIQLNESPFQCRHTHIIHSKDGMKNALHGIPSHRLDKATARKESIIIRKAEQESTNKNTAM